MRHLAHVYRCKEVIVARTASGIPVVEMWRVRIACVVRIPSVVAWLGTRVVSALPHHFAWRNAIVKRLHPSIAVRKPMDLQDAEILRVRRASVMRTPLVVRFNGMHRA